MAYNCIKKYFKCDAASRFPITGTPPSPIDESFALQESVTGAYLMPSIPSAGFVPPDMIKPSLTDPDNSTRMFCYPAHMQATTDFTAYEDRDQNFSDQIGQFPINKDFAVVVVGRARRADAADEGDYDTLDPSTGGNLRIAVRADALVGDAVLFEAGILQSGITNPGGPGGRGSRTSVYCSSLLREMGEVYAYMWVHRVPDADHPNGRNENFVWDFNLQEYRKAGQNDDVTGLVSEATAINNFECSHMSSGDPASIIDGGQPLNSPFGSLENSTTTEPNGVSPCNGWTFQADIDQPQDYYCILTANFDYGAPDDQSLLAALKWYREHTAGINMPVDKDSHYPGWAFQTEQDGAVMPDLKYSEAVTGNPIVSLNGFERIGISQDANGDGTGAWNDFGATTQQIKDWVNSYQSGTIVYSDGASGELEINTTAAVPTGANKGALTEMMQFNTQIGNNGSAHMIDIAQETAPVTNGSNVHGFRVRWIAEPSQYTDNTRALNAMSFLYDIRGDKTWTGAISGMEVDCRWNVATSGVLNDIAGIRVKMTQGGTGNVTKASAIEIPNIQQIAETQNAAGIRFLGSTNGSALVWDTTDTRLWFSGTGGGRLAIEGAEAVVAGTTFSFTNALQINYNGTNYYIPLATSAPT